MPFIWAASESDVREAEMVGRGAVSAVQEGIRDVIVTIEREDGPGIQISNRHT